MWINLGKLLMLAVWGILLFNLFAPFPKPLLYFMHIGLGFMVITHALQLLLFKTTLTKQQPRLSAWQQCNLFLFGAFELLCWRKKLEKSS